MNKLLSLLGCMMLGQFSIGQRPSDNWDLQHCIQHAIQFNISIQQADVQARIAALQAKQAKYNMYPTLNGNANTGVRFGRSIDPSTNTFSTTQFLYQSFGINAGFQLFNNGSLKNQVLQAQFNAQAALADVDRAKNDITFNVATYYLQVLSAKEQVKIAEVQISQTQSQIDITRKQVEVGSLPELSITEAEAQMALDSSNFYTARGNYEQSLLALRALLNLDTDVIFGIATPPVDQIPLELLAELQPEFVYQSALTMQPQQKVNEFRIKAAQKNILVSKAIMYPTLSLGGNLSTNFSNSFKKVSGVSFLGYSPITGSEPIITLSGVNHYLQSPIYKVNQSSQGFGDIWKDWHKQISDNFGQNIGLNLSIPIFNNYQGRTAYRRAELELKSATLAKSQSDQTLRQNIFTAYANALTALQKFNAGKKTVGSTQKAYDFALKRFEVGLLSSLDLITNQNRLLSAKLQQLNNLYDYVFKMKLLEFYKGTGLKL